MVGDHPLGVEALWRMPANQSIRRIRRFCRKRNAIEDECHLILQCLDPRVTMLRIEFYSHAREEDESWSLEDPLRIMEPTKALAELLHRTAILLVLARYVYALFKLCEEVPILMLRNGEECAALE